LELPARPAGVRLPDPYLIEILMPDGSVEEVPWDFARHFADPGYRARSEAAADRGRRTFAERLKRFRSEAGLTQGELAERAGIHRVTVARYESGRRHPGYETLETLAEALALPVGRLLSG
jgi:DNA-binding XRE family transcriptional regulator